MDDFNIGGDSYLILFLIVLVVFGLIFSIDFLYVYMKYSPLISIGFLLTVLYGLYKIKIPERINDKFWPLVPSLKWAMGIVSFVLIICMLIRVFG